MTTLVPCTSSQINLILRYANDSSRLPVGDAIKSDKHNSNTRPFKPSEAILLPATTFFQLKNPFEDIWVKKIKISARSTAKWKRPKASSVGLDKILDYDEAYELFKNASPDEFQKQSTTGKQWGEKKEEKMVRKKSEGSKL